MQIEDFAIPVEPPATARIHRRPSHGQVKAIMRTYRRVYADGTEPGSEMDVITDTILTMTESWTVKDEKGKSIPLSREGVEEAPNDAVNALYVELSKVLEGAFPNV